MLVGRRTPSATPDAKMRTNAPFSSNSTTPVRQLRSAGPARIVSETRRRQLATLLGTTLTAWLLIVLCPALTPIGQVAMALSVAAAWMTVRKRTTLLRLERIADVLETRSASWTDVERGVHGAVRQLKEANTRIAHSEERWEAEREAYQDALANTVHELRTPLTTIVATLEMVQFGMLDDPVDREELVAQADAACHHMSFLVNDLLDAAAIAAGRLRLDFTNFTASRVLGEARRILNPTAHARDIDLRMEGDESVLDVQIRADKMRTLQVLFNLAGNAIKYSEDGTCVTLRVGRDPHGDLLRFEVRDQGVGVPPDMREELFGRFSRVHRSTDTHASGSGVGLHFSKTLIERMDGEIGYHAREDGPGSVFWFALPLASIEAETEIRVEHTDGE